jgi:nucleoside-diphosphate-sugar epimerase
MKNTIKTILVTGGAGFIGSHLVKRLIKDGHDIHLLLRKDTNCFRIQDEFKNLNCHHVNLLDREGIHETIKIIKPHGVFHLAASNIASGVTASDEEVLNTNIIGFKNLVDGVNSLDYEFFVNTGSFMEYGPKDGPVEENSICEPTELYSISKLSATLYGQAMAKKFSKPIITFRLFTPYGPAVQPGRLVYEVVNRALSGTSIEVSNRDVARDFVFVEDIIDLYILAIEKASEFSGQIFNLGSGQAVSIGELVEKVIEKTVSVSKILWGNKPLLAYDSKLWQANMNKTSQAFAWVPKYTLDNGLEKTIQSFKDK